MFDDLRKSALEPFDEIPEEKQEPVPSTADEESADETEGRAFLGLTAPQRFILSLALLFMTCLLSVVCLVLTERVILPIY